MAGSGQQTQRIAVASGVSLAVDMVGTPGDPVLMLLHGGGQTRHSWKKGAETFARLGFHVWSIDARGHGDSDWSPEGDYSWDALRNDLAALVARTDRPPLLVGASMGGLTALLLEGEAGQSLARGLVLVDVTPRVDRAGVERITSFMSAHLEGFETVEQAAAALADYNPHRRRPASAAGLAQVLRRRGGRYHWHWDPRLVQSDGEAQEDEARFIAAARRVRVPTLLVRAGASDLVGPEQVAHLLTLIPHAQTVDVAGAGHMVAGDRNDAFVEALLPFLEQFLGHRDVASRTKT